MTDAELFPVPSDFSKTEKDTNLPLAARMRPRTLDEIAGQLHLLAPGKLLRRTVESDRWTSVHSLKPGLSLQLLSITHQGHHHCISNLVLLYD